MDLEIHRDWLALYALAALFTFIFFNYIFVVVRLELYDPMSLPPDIFGLYISPQLYLWPGLFTCMYTASRAVSSRDVEQWINRTVFGGFGILVAYLMVVLAFWLSVNPYYLSFDFWYILFHMPSVVGLICVWAIGVPFAAWTLLCILGWFIQGKDKSLRKLN